MSDLISRTGAIAHFDKVAEELDEQRGDDSWVGNAFKICLLGVVNDLAVLPSADRPTGEWVRLEREENVYDLHGVPTWGVNYMCDKCGFITTAIQDHFEQYKFCPHCGKRLVIER